MLTRQKKNVAAVAVATARKKNEQNGYKGRRATEMREKKAHIYDGTGGI